MVADTIDYTKESQKEVKPLRAYTKDGGMKLNLHSGQLRAWNSKKRFVAIISGTQGGKTSFAPHWLLREISIKGVGDYIYVTPTYALLDKKALPEFLEIFEKKGKLGRFFSGKMKFVFNKAGMDYIHGKGSYEIDEDSNPVTPTQVFFGYATKPDSLESMTAKAAVLDEAGQKDFKLDSWFAILRRLSLNQGRVLIGTTPYTFNWLYTHVYQEWIKGNPDYDVISFPSIANPMFPLKEAEDAKKRMPDWKYQMFYNGKFTKPAGLIYDCFNDKHLQNPFKIPLSWKRVCCIDFGGVNGAATFYAINPLTQVAYLYAEYFPRQYKPIRFHCIDMMKKKANCRVVENPNNSRIIYRSDDWHFIAGASAETQWRIELSQYGIESSPSYVKSVEQGIGCGYALLKLNKIKIFKTCEHTIAEFNTYSRPTDIDGEVKENEIKDKATFHLLDTYRYFSSYYGNEDINPDWTIEDLSSMMPNNEILSLHNMIDNDDVDLDNPRIQKLLRDVESDSMKRMMRKDRILLDEDDTTY